MMIVRECRNCGKDFNRSTKFQRVCNKCWVKSKKHYRGGGKNIWNKYLRGEKI